MENKKIHADKQVDIRSNWNRQINQGGHGERGRDWGGESHRLRRRKIEDKDLRRYRYNDRLPLW